MENRIIIIDGNSLINRAYYAMQRPMITKEGIYTQGIYGFINMLEKIKKDYEPEYITVAFDIKAPTFRHKEFDDYKAGRKKMPIELAMQMPILKEILKAMNIKVVELEGFEADDIIGTIAREGEEKGLHPIIITGDKDALQLATDYTEVLITKKGISQFALYDQKAFKEEYGFEPIQFIDCKGIMGDKSDNIPGIPGIGEKGAIKLIIEYGTMENIYNNIENVTPKGTQMKLMEHQQLAYMSKKLATINRYVPIDIDFKDYRSEDADYHHLVELYKKLEFNNFLKNMKIPSLQSQNQSLTEYEIIKIRDIEELEQIENFITEKKEIGLKVFSNNSHMQTPKIEEISLMLDSKIYHLYVRNDAQFIEKIIEIIENNDLSLYGHAVKSDIYAMMHFGIKNIKISFDTAVAQYVIDSGRSNYELKALANEVLHVNLEENEVESQIDMFSGEESAENNLKGLNSTFAVINALMEYQKKVLNDDGLNEIFYDVELPLVETMAYMEFIGFRVNEQYLIDMGKELSIREEKLEEKIYMLSGEKFNIKSPKQLGVILFEKLRLPIIKKTKSGYSTGAEILEKLKDKHDIVPLILEFRKLTKLNSTYVAGLLPLIGDDNKIHASFNQTVTTTGRISSSNPNMQNIPIREELGRKIRGAFIPESDEYILVGADYSQIELRVLAHMSKDKALIDSFNNGQDVHKTTAARIMGIAENEVTSLQRSRAKAINFGVIYGMSSFGLSEELSITRNEASSYINDYFEKHKAVKEFMDREVRECKEKGYVKTILGRKRYIKEINASNFNLKQLGERLAMNTPIQGSAADIIKLAMIRAYKALKGMKSRLILQVHDELIIETHKLEIEEVKKIIKIAMEDAIKLNVELSVDLNIGNNWQELK